jgi:hypothetical protein
LARYKPSSHAQGKFISIYFEDQILTGTFEHTLSHLIDRELDLSFFDQRYQNDETGVPGTLHHIICRGIRATKHF